MLISNVIIGLRHIIKKPVYSFTTIAGLALGVATCLMIFHYIHYERSYDQYHEKIDELAVVYYDVHTIDLQDKSPSAPHFVGPKLQREFPEVINQARLLPGYGTRVVKVNDHLFEETSFANADSSLLDLFSYRLVKGDRADQLKRPNTVLLTESAARKYFGEDDPIGKTILINNRREYEVTGVLQDIPLNSHMRFDLFMPMANVGLPQTEEWDSPNFVTYLQVAKGADLKAFQSKINEAWLSKNEMIKLELHWLAELHFDTSAKAYMKVTDPAYLTIFSIIAVLILTIACINYVNLVTARAAERGREVGIRKVSGATGQQLFSQFMTDSFLHILPAIFIALMIFFLMLPFANSFLGLQGATISFQEKMYVFLLAVVILIVVTLAAGLYPAAVMTRFRPVAILKGKFQVSRSSNSFRKGLVVFQFCISIAMIVCTVVISGQLSYMQNKKLGFDKERTLILTADEVVMKKFEAFRAELKKLPAVSHVVPVSVVPTKVITGYGAYLNETKSDLVVLGALRTNADFLEAMNVKLIAGKNFSADRESRPDSIPLQFLVNETFLWKYGFSEKEVLGKRISLGIAGGVGEIIGVVNDFHTGSLHSKIEPLVIYDRGGWIGNMMVKLNAGNTQEQLSKLEAVWKEFAPHRPFAYTFLDESYNSLYQTEMQINTLVHIFSSLAILIACLGILGLVSYNATQRVKEISIRKVLGASSPGIMLLLSKDFIRLIGIAFVLAAPVAYWFSSDWLKHFEYRISIGVSPFIGAAVVAFGFALLTIAYQTIKAARLNPASALKME
jgi:putative ABC transport system permease protein